MNLLRKMLFTEKAAKLRVNLTCIQANTLGGRTVALDAFLTAAEAAKKTITDNSYKNRRKP